MDIISDTKEIQEQLVDQLAAQHQVLSLDLKYPAKWRGKIRRELKKNLIVPRENRRYAQAFNRIVSNRDEYEQYSKPDLLRQIHYLVSGKGEFRKTGVKIGRFRDFPHSADVPNRIERMFELIDLTNEPAVLKAAKMHTEVLLIHPFSDGNGRAARLLATYELLNAGFKSTLFTAVEQHFAYNPNEYIRLMEAYRQNKIKKDRVHIGFLKAMEINSYYAYWFRQRKNQLYEWLLANGMSSDQAEKNIVGYDLNDNKSRRNYKALKKLEREYPPLYKLKRQFSRSKLRLLMDQLIRIREEEDAQFHNFQ